jgi:cytochrome P450
VPGGGAHICIGMQFAFMAARLALHHMLVRHRFERTSLRDPDLVILPITHPKDGLPLRLTPI